MAAESLARVARLLTQRPPPSLRDLRVASLFFFRRYHVVCLEKSIASGTDYNDTGNGPTTATTYTGWNIAQRTSSVQYDGYGEFPVLATDALSQTETPTNSQDFGTPTTLVFYDALGRVVAQDTQAFDGNWNQIDTEYDVNGNLAARSKPYETTLSISQCPGTECTFFSNDRLGRPTEADYASDAGGTSKTTYGYAALTTSVTNDLAQTTATTRNVQGLVASVTDANSQTTSYTYDAYGDVLTVSTPDNMKCVTPAGSGCSDAARSYSWTSFDMAGTITQAADSSTLAYDPEHSRGSLADSSTGNTTWYLNNPAADLRSELLQGSTATWRDYMMAYGEIVAERFDTANTPSVYYFVGDHLASTTALTDVNQNEEEYDSGACAPAALRADRGDAWGKRRNVNGTEWNGCLSLHPPSATLRGYTGQEEMNSYCLVNLNARLYDPTLGRFLSADSMVPDALNGQGFNRYSYVLNNPLAMTDPSGHEDDGIFPIVCYECSSGSGGMPSDSMPCWDCTGPRLTNDIYGNPVPAANFAGGWNSYSIGWNAPNYNAPTCGVGKTSGCWTPTSGGSSSNPDGTAVTVWSSHSYWVPGPSTGSTNELAEGFAIFAGASGAAEVTGLSALFICGLAEPCGVIAGGVALTAGAGGLLAGVSAMVTGLSNQNGLAATALIGGLIGGTTGAASIALDLSGTMAVGIGTGSAFLGGFGGDLAGQAAAGLSLNLNQAAVSGLTSGIGYFGGGSFAVDALGLPLSSIPGLVTSINSSVVGTAGVFIANHLI